VRAHADPHLTCILVGNKNDLASERREVFAEEGEQWARDEGLLFVEASAKSGANVEAAFEAAARDILVKIRQGVFDDDRVRLVVLYPSPFPHANCLQSLQSPGIKLSKPAAGGVALDQNKSGGTCCGS
jgi:Ras-related protein Rab-2A